VTVLGHKARELRHLLSRPDISRVVGVGDGLSAMLGERHRFDALWASGLSISASHGLPDASLLTMTEFLAAARQIDRATSLPVLADCDTGFGDANMVMRTVREYESAGIAGISIEDQQFPKRNSFCEGPELLPVEDFVVKLRAAKAAQQTDDFVIVARIESLIVGAGLDDALVRARRYREAGADAILIHSKATSEHEVVAFAEFWRQESQGLPLLALPTTYPMVSHEVLHAAGFAMVIYANHAVRAAMEAVDQAFRHLSDSSCSEALEPHIASLQELLTLIGMDRLHGHEPTYGTNGLP
jgi:phosphoenolpyruvate phosphomutase